MKPLSEILGRKAPRPDDRLLLVPDSTAASPMVIGKNIQLRPPVPGVLFHVTTRKTIRARAAVMDTPPAPLPENMAAFTPIVALAHSPDGVFGTVAISMKVRPGLCAPERFSALKLYAWDSEQGWHTVTGQKVSAQSQSFSALDLGLRTYAVLGPKEHLVQADPG